MPSNIPVVDILDRIPKNGALDLDNIKALLSRAEKLPSNSPLLEVIRQRLGEAAELRCGAAKDVFDVMFKDAVARKTLTAHGADVFEYVINGVCRVRLPSKG